MDVSRIGVRLVRIAAVCLAAGCTGDDSSGCKPPEDPATAPLDGAVCAASAGPFSNVMTNEFFPLTIGTAFVIEGNGERVEITATVDTRLVAGVNTRVVQEYETVGGELVEVSRNFMVVATDGTLCYYGEEVDLYEGGVIVGTEGAWLAGVGGAEPGILMPGSVAVGQWYRQENAVGVAQDNAIHTAMGQSYTVPGGTFVDTLTVEEWSPLECGISNKVYARDVGMIIDDGAEYTLE